MPLTFSSFKSQRFRWCFGGIQILRRHFRDLLPWQRSADNHLTVAQRLDYLFGGVQWFTDLLYLGFTLVLVATAVLLITTGHVALRPLLGTAVLLPATLIASGVLRALWALRTTTGIGTRRALLAFANWLSMSWTVSLACVQGILHSEGVFLRTPKWKGTRSFKEVLQATRAESAIALGLWGLGVMVALRHVGTLFLGLLFAWQGGVYASSPFMAWLNVRSELSAPLERRRRTEERRERIRRYGPYVAGATAALAIEGIALAVILLGGAGPGTPNLQPLKLPRRSPADPGPFQALVHLPETLPSLVPEAVRSDFPVFGLSTSTATPATEASPTPPARSPAAAVLTTPSPSASPRPSPSPSPSPRPSPIASPSVTSTATAPPTGTVVPSPFP
jgi:hypothetical protein